MVELHNIYIKVLKEGRCIYNNINKTTINEAYLLESYSNYMGDMHNQIDTLQKLIHKYSMEFLTKASEIRKSIDLIDKYNIDPDNMNFNSINIYSGMRWADIDQLLENRDKIMKNVDDIIDSKTSVDYRYKPISYKTLKEINNIDVGFDVKIPIINKLTDIPSSFYWYSGDETNSAGIYTCITTGFYIKVPLPDVIDSTNTRNKTGSVKCKHNTLDACHNSRYDLSKKYNSELRECGFAHTGDSYIKIGTYFRCPCIPRFGKHIFLKNDLNNVPDTDIKTILMYSLSDILLTLLWFQRQHIDGKQNIVFNNIDIV